MKAFFGVLFYIMLCFSGRAQTTLVEWNFPNGPDDAIADAGIPVNLTKTISAVGASGTLSFGLLGATTYSASNTGWDNGSGTKYWTVDFSTSGYYSITISSKQQSSNTGPRDFKIQYRIGAGLWTDIPGANITVANNFTSGVLSNIALPTECDNQSSVSIRWILTSNTSVDNGLIGSTGTSRVDDIILKGILISSVSNPLGYFRTRVSGDWNIPVCWESSNDGNTWITADISPTSSANTIIIRNGHTITINSNVSADQLTIESGATLNHSNTATFTLNDHASGTDMIVNGTYVLNGIKPAGAGTCVINSGAVVRVAANSGGESDDFAHSTNTAVLFKTGSVFEWASSSIFGASGITYFSSNAEFPIFRISANV
ncbi:MAG: hypothetical protein GXC73_05015, partial [Chitinophagaceae bacterium]|nr:hypothetical protein [Chitinophagaceae bacterium]